MYDISTKYRPINMRYFSVSVVNFMISIGQRDFTYWNKKEEFNSFLKSLQNLF